MTDMAEQGLYLYTFILYESALRNKNKKKKQKKTKKKKKKKQQQKKTTTKKKQQKTYSPFLNRMMKTRIALD